MNPKNKALGSLILREEAEEKTGCVERRCSHRILTGVWWNQKKEEKGMDSDVRRGEKPPAQQKGHGRPKNLCSDHKGVT